MECMHTRRFGNSELEDLTCRLTKAFMALVDEGETSGGLLPSSETHSEMKSAGYFSPETGRSARSRHHPS